MHRVGLALLIAVILVPSVVRAAWYDTKYKYRRPITLDGTQIMGTLSDFPVLISFPGSPDPASDDLVAAGAVATEILFTDTDGSTKLDHEIEDYNPATGELVAWVEVDLTLSTDKTIYVYYGNRVDPGTDQQNAAGVWDANFVGVWHLNESPGDGVAGHADSTGNPNVGTPQNFEDGAGTTDATGKIAGADYFAGDNDYVDCGNDAVLNVDYVTAEAWVNVNNWVANGGILAKGGNATRQYWMWVFDEAGSFEVDEGGNVNHGWDFLSGEWHRLVLTYDGSNVITYRNGVQENVFPQTTGVIDSETPNLLFGHIPGWFYFDGTLDEIRISDTTRSAAWIETDHNTQNDPGSFMKTVGTEEFLSDISGTVFEDVNYGGGAGRDLATAGADAPAFTVERNNVTVELYDAAGNHLGAVSPLATDASGSYSFLGLSPGPYIVRVVNDTVTSTRTGSDGSEVGVQTFRSDGASEPPGAGAKKVGGELPSKEDAAANSGAQTLAALQGTDLDLDGVQEWTQSIVTVDASGGDVTGVDFGFNFDVIVNTNDAGQGSLRQFILNASLLK